MEYTELRPVSTERYDNYEAPSGDPLLGEHSAAERIAVTDTEVSLFRSEASETLTGYVDNYTDAYSEPSTFWEFPSSEAVVATDAAEVCWLFTTTVVVLC